MKSRKRLTAIILISLALLALCGCCSHEWQEATCTAPKTCVKCGETEGEPLPHTWNDATCDKPKTCSVCGATEGSALGHTWSDATCTEPQICSVCGKTKGAPLGHSAAPATCTEDSVCSRCGEVLEKATGHEWIKATVSRPKTCAVCGQTEGSPLPYKYFPKDSYQFIDAYNKSEHALGKLSKDSNIMYLSGTKQKVLIFVYDESDSSGGGSALDNFYTIPYRKITKMMIRYPVNGTNDMDSTGLAISLLASQSFAEVFDPSFSYDAFAENWEVSYTGRNNGFTCTYSHNGYDYELYGHGTSDALSASAGASYYYDFTISLIANRED